jgi:hypothetical protein
MRKFGLPGQIVKSSDPSDIFPGFAGVQFVAKAGRQGWQE